MKKLYTNVKYLYPNFEENVGMRQICLGGEGHKLSTAALKRAQFYGRVVWRQ